MADEREERAAVAADIRGVREAARETNEPRSTTLPPARPTAAPTKVDPLAASASSAAPIRPGVDDVHRLAELTATPPGGIRGALFRLLRRILAPQVNADIAFGVAQARLDAAVLDYVDARADATHRHYDAVLGHYGQHIADANRRHAILQSELVAHVHDLVDRIDLVLAESERGRLSLEASLRDVRARLRELEERTGGSRPR